MKVTFTPAGVQISAGVGYCVAMQFLLASIGPATGALVVSAALTWLRCNWRR